MPEELYGETRESALIYLLGKTAETRLIDFFLDNREIDFSRREIMEALGMHKVTLNKSLEKLIESGLVKPSRRIGRSMLYKVDEENAVTRHLIEVVVALSVQEAERQLGLEGELTAQNSARNGLKIPV